MIQRLLVHSNEAATSDTLVRGDESLTVGRSPPFNSKSIYFWKGFVVKKVKIVEKSLEREEKEVDATEVQTRVKQKARNVAE